MKNEVNSVNALSTDKLLSNTRFKLFQIYFIRNVTLTSNAFTWYVNYNSIANNRGGINIW